EDRVIFYSHGGGFVSGSIYTHRKMVGHLAKALGCLGLRPRAKDDLEHLLSLINEGQLPASEKQAIALTMSEARSLEARRAPGHPKSRRTWRTKCTSWGIVPGVTARSLACCETLKAGRSQPRNMAASMCRFCSFGATRTGRGRPNA